MILARNDGNQLTESQFFERAVVRLGVHEVDEREFKGDPCAVDGKVLPLNGGKGNGIDVDGEETSQLSENLFDTDTHGTLRIREQLDKVCVCERVVSDVVTRRVGKVEEQRCDLGR